MLSAIFSLLFKKIKNSKSSNQLKFSFNFLHMCYLSNAYKTVWRKLNIFWIVRYGKKYGKNSFLHALRIHGGFSEILRTSKKVNELMVFDIVKVQVCLFWKVTKKFPSDKISVTNYALVLLSRVPAHHNFISLVCRVFFIFASVSFLLKVIFLFKKSMDSLTLTHHNFFRN